MGWRWWWLLLGVTACAAPAAVRPAAPTPAPTVATALPPAPSVDPPVHDCAQDAEAESPIAHERLGTGERLVRIHNNSDTDIQARLLTENAQAAVPGTLVVKAGSAGEFHVEAGVYMVRYRRKGNCEVRRGGKLHLTGPRAGVDISIKPSRDKTSDSKMQKVTEPL